MKKLKKYYYILFNCISISKLVLLCVSGVKYVLVNVICIEIVVNFLSQIQMCL
jgi:hypothetical protein